MEAYTYSSSYPDSGDSSPRSREIDCDTAAAAAWDELPPPSSRVKLMCSYGGRIQPRSHDNQLSYVGGDTKILTVDRSVRFPSLIAKLAALSASDDVILKYQLPGEDLDALISVTNDEDLEHMMMEYDRLHRIASKPVPRLRLFLFPSMGKLIGSRDRGWGFADVTPSPVTSSAAKGAADFLFGLEKGAVQPAAVPVVTSSETEPVVSPTEMQKHVQDLQKLQIAENNQTNQREALSVPRNGSDEALARVYTPDYYVHQPQEKAPPAAQAEAAAQTYWQDHQMNVAPVARFASIVGGDQQFYLIPANPGVFQSNAAPGQGYYTTMQRMVPTAAYDSAAAVYSMARPPQAKAAYDNGGRVQAVDGSAGYSAAPAGAYDNNGGGYAAYDSSGRAVFYAGTAPTYQTASNVAIAAAESKVLKPSEVS